MIRASKTCGAYERAAARRAGAHGHQKIGRSPNGGRTVDGVSATVSAASVGDIHPTGKYNATMTVGKKPGSTDPHDAFAGRLKDLVITH